MRKQKGFTLLELLIVVVILGVLALIAAPAMLSAADKAKEGAVKANISAASSTATSEMGINGVAAAAAATNTITKLNTDGAKNPFDSSAAAYAAAGTTEGSTVVTGVDGTGVTIVGYGSGSAVLATKVVRDING